MTEQDRTDHREGSAGAPFESGTPLHELLVVIGEQAGEGSAVSDLVLAYSQGLGATAESAKEDRHPFLSVLMRTQGKREMTIQEALLALAAQTSQDFELLVLAHDVSPDGIRELHALVDSFGEDFSSRVRVIPVEGGGRSRPLNVGIDSARGLYLAMLDDDDIVFAHWVETYKYFATQTPGRVIRCVPAEQDVRPTAWPGGKDGFGITSRPRCPWPKRFDLVDHFYENRTPNCNFAFPRSACTDLGIRFDETLPVVEDWDVLLRTALLCGVVDTDTVTSLWRKWDRSGDSSSTAHSRSDWHQSRDAVIAKLDRQPLILPAQSASRLSELVAVQDQFRAVKGSILWRMLLPVRFARRLKRRVAPWWTPRWLRAHPRD
jgi:glycosyltransferase involved in cell wall biosynthesis